VGEKEVSQSLAHRLEDIPGVAEVIVDLDDEGGGINIRLEPGADEDQVMERLRTLLVAYGVRSSRPEKSEAPARATDLDALGVQVRITPIASGARVEVEGPKVKSFRIVSATPGALAQGLCDAWCQVLGRIPVEVTGLGLGDAGELTLEVSDGESTRTGSANVGDGWEHALIFAVAQALGLVADSSEDESSEPAAGPV
jgi:hypothetical protein